VSSSLAQRDHFGVGGWIVRQYRLVEAAANHRIVHDNDRADWNLTCFFRLASFQKRQIHVVLVRVYGHDCMLHLFSMRFLSAALMICMLAGGLCAQGVRMSADFLPLDVGNRWVYDVFNEDGQKIGDMDFAVQEYTIVKGHSFYALTRFP